MKIQCEVCEKAEAEVLCCADEAALCRRCDHKIHAANKLSTKHHRLSIFTHHPFSHFHLCDICRKKNGRFFCIEDRSFLCKQCDESIHVANPYVSTHTRFLIAGAIVGHQSLDDVVQNSKISSIGDDGGGQSSNPSSSLLSLHLDGGVAKYNGKISETTAATSSGEAYSNAQNCGPHWPVLDNDERMILNYHHEDVDFNYYDEFSDMESSRITAANNSTSK